MPSQPDKPPPPPEEKPVRKDPQPWPMKYVFYAILIYIFLQMLYFWWQATQR